jgi:hypothetical protein
MKIKTIILCLVLVALCGGLTLLAVSDVPVKSAEVRKTIPNEQFFKN